jgi:hypothetical protein
LSSTIMVAALSGHPYLDWRSNTPVPGWRLFALRINRHCKKNHSQISAKC